MQLEQIVLPDDEVNLPGGQRSQMSVPGVAAYEPGKHSEHLVAFELPGTGLALPAGQGRHAELSEAPSVGLKVPAGQEFQTKAVAAPASSQ